MDDLVITILAAGKGTRLNSSIDKVCHYVGDKTMIEHIVLTSESLTPHEIVLVVSKNNIEQIRQILRHYDVRLKIQPKPLGTGSAVLSSVPCCGKPSPKKDLLVLMGDIPLITSKTLEKISTTSYDAVIVGFVDKTNNNQYDRIVIENKRVLKIIKFFDANLRERKNILCDSGVIWLKYNHVKLLYDIEKNNSSGEYHLTDIVEIMVNKGLKVGFLESTKSECMGVNTQQELFLANI